jgi:hypothetical protein
MNKTSVGKLGMFLAAAKLTEMGRDITVHGGSCAFDMSDYIGDRYEVKTAKARIFLADKDHVSFRGWTFSSGDGNRNIAKYEYTVYVLLNEEAKVERMLLIPREDDRYKNGKTAVMKDTVWQVAHCTNPGARKKITEKWYDKYDILNLVEKTDGQR